MANVMYRSVSSGGTASPFTRALDSISGMTPVSIRVLVVVPYILVSTTLRSRSVELSRLSSITLNVALQPASRRPIFILASTASPCITYLRIIPE